MMISSFAGKYASMNFGDLETQKNSVMLTRKRSNLNKNQEQVSLRYF